MSVGDIIKEQPTWEFIGELPTPKEIILGGELSESLIREISQVKKEPPWMLRLRLKAYELWKKLPTPRWLEGVDELDIGKLTHYIKPAISKTESTKDLPSEILEYYKRLGIPEIEAQMLAGFAGILDSETIVAGLKDWLRKRGILLLDMEEAVQKYPNLVKKYFGKVYPMADHKFAALHYALWSGGAFVYVPKGIRIEQPIEAFFMISTMLESQYEHTLIVAEENSYLHFVEGCAAPILPTYSFHDGAVEVYVHKGAHVRFTTIQNWSKAIINFNNKRAIVESNGYVEWLEGGIGAKVSYVYPSAVLRGEGARASVLTVSLSNGPYIKDSGAKIYHLAPNTTSEVISKSIVANGGKSVYRGLIYVSEGAKNARSHVQCDSLILDEDSVSSTIPHNQVLEPTAEVTHEASVGQLDENLLFYMESRGFSESEAKSLLVLGFIGDILAELPFDMAKILNKVIQLEFEEAGGVG